MANLVPEHIDRTFPKDHNFEGGDSPASTPSLHAAKRRKMDPTTNLTNGDLAPAATMDSASLSNPSKWQDTIESIVKAIVSIRFSQVAAFDTEGKRSL
jgi:hypothetical protein